MISSSTCSKKQASDRSFGSPENLRFHLHVGTDLGYEKLLLTAATVDENTFSESSDSSPDEDCVLPKLKEQWAEVASQSEDRRHFKNCGGDLVGNHIRIVPPPKSSVLYYNNKNFYSVVSMALVNSNYEFMYVDVGKQGRMSDGGVMEWTLFYHKSVGDELNMPNTSETKGNFNFVLVDDAVFALHEHISTPYPEKGLDYHQRIYNYSLSRARNVVL
ncbi:hypothetical protein JTB14_001561 [Gonioctena quinquepunctata]|nr:hypothetical protein JTB14_001561 [Gonioctena quinquepunctata]